MDAQLPSFINRSRLIRKQTPFGYTYVWRVKDGIGETLEMDMDEFSQYISENLARLRVKKVTF